MIHKKPPAIIFVRVSKKDMEYQRQVADLQETAKSKGCQVIEIITKKVSGARRTNDRPVLQHLMAFAEE